MRVAIIPSSHDSSRLPGKNTLLVNGKPMIAYPIQAAQKSGMFDKIIVSTADKETTEIAKDLGCVVFPSPAALQARDSTVVKVCRNVLAVLTDIQKTKPEYFCCIYATAIFLKPEDFEQSSSLLEWTDFVMCVSEFNYEPWHSMVEKYGCLHRKYPDAHFRKAAALFRGRTTWARHLSSNGTFYWAKTDAFLREGTFYGPHLKGYEISKYRGFDINTPEDFEIVQKLSMSGLAPNLPTE